MQRTNRLDFAEYLAGRNRILPIQVIRLLLGAGCNAQHQNLRVGRDLWSGLRSTVRIEEPYGDVFQQAEHGAETHDESKYINGKVAVMLTNEVITINVVS